MISLPLSAVPGWIQNVGIRDFAASANR